jgi:hypothetical protein
MKAAEQEDNIYDLTARESARIRRPHVDLLIEALADIAQGTLNARFEPEADPLSLTRSVGARWQNDRHGMLTQEIHALRRRPWVQCPWIRCVMVTYNDFLRWRSERLNPALSSKAERPARISNRDVLVVVRRYLDKERAEGRPGSQKRAWEYVKIELEGATFRQVVGALRRLEGRKRRGRPRATRTE